MRHSPGVQFVCDEYCASELRGMGGTENHFRKSTRRFCIELAKYVTIIQKFVYKCSVKKCASYRLSVWDWGV